MKANTVAQVVAVLTVGTSGFVALEGLTVVDALYLTTVTLSTVGFGDVVPSHNLSRLFAAFVSLIGLAMFATLVEEMGAWRRVLRRSSVSKLTEAFLCLAVVLIAGATALFLADGTPFVDGLWYSFITATSVGYGDVLPRSDLAKLLTSAFIILSCGPLAFVTSTISDAVFSKVKSKAY